VGQVVHAAGMGKLVLSGLIHNQVQSDW